MLGGGAKTLVKTEPILGSSTRAAQQFASGDTRVHIYFLLDRSGSMQSIADDVIGGFNAFVKEQQASSQDSAGLSMTMVQFDSGNPHEVLLSSRDINDVPFLCEKTFQPRSMTPLFDAIGNTIAMADEASLIKLNSCDDMQNVIVILSDGYENASREHSRKSVFSLIEAKQKHGWTFVFLGANQDSYAEGGKLGFGSKNIQNFKFDGQGTREAWSAVCGATKNMRTKLQRKERFDHEDFFDGVKTAEADKDSRDSGKGPPSRSV